MELGLGESIFGVFKEVKVVRACADSAVGRHLGWAGISCVNVIH